MIVHYKDKTKVWIMIACCLIIGVLGVAYGLINIQSIASRTINTSTIFIVIFICVTRMKPQFNQIIKIQEEGIYFANCYDKVHNPPMDVEIKYNEIVKLTYSGAKIIPMSESLIVETTNEKIYIDFNFNNYKKLWQDIYLKCKDKNPLIEVDKRLFKRFQK